MEKLRMRRMKKLRKYLMIFGVLSVISLLFWGALWILMAGAKSYQKWNDLDFESDLSWVYVTYMAEDLEGPYYVYVNKDDEDDRTEFYFVLVQNRYIMPVCYVEYAQLEKVHAYMKAKESYLSGEISEQELQAKRVITQGKIYRADDDSDHLADLEKYLTKHSEFSGTEYEILPYSLMAQDTDTIWIGTVVFGFFILLPMITMLICVIRVRTSWGEGMLTQYCQEEGDTLLLRRKIDVFFSDYEICPSFWMNQEYIAGLYNTKVIFGKLREVTGMYIVGEVGVTGNVAADAAVILTSDPASIQIHFADGGIHQVQLDSRQDADVILELIHDKCVWIETN